MVSEALASSPVGWLFLPILGVVLALLFSLAFAHFRSCYSYWSHRGIKNPIPVWGIGNLYARLRPTLSMAEFDQWLYKKCGGNRLCGFYEFTQPVLMVGDPQLLKDVMIRDFDHFCDRSFVVFNEPIMDDMLLGLKGSVWKRVRSVMTPVFSSGKVKQTLSLVNDCATNLLTFFNKKIDEGQSVFEMKEVYGMFTMDTIASIAFGVNSDSLNNTQDEFSAAAARFFSPAPAHRKPLLWLQHYLPAVTRWFGMVQRTPIQFFSKVVSDTMAYRLKHQLRRSDFLQMLLDASLLERNNNNKTKGGKKATEGECAAPVLTKEVITAQCVLFYMAGYDTTATTLSFASYCLALNPGIQQRVMEELEKVLEEHDNVVSYEALQEMTFLDRVLSETLRLYPPAPHVDRCCVKEYHLKEADLTIEQGVKVTIPIYSIQRDEKYWPEPEKFDPDRFLPENKCKISQTTYMPFGAGPRNCIGKRFALMEAKIALVHLLQDFAFLPSKKTQVPIALEKTSGLLKAEKGVHLRLAKRITEQ